jgi:hypothetical protein
MKVEFAGDSLTSVLLGKEPVEKIARQRVRVGLAANLKRS